MSLERILFLVLVGVMIGSIVTLQDPTIGTLLFFVSLVSVLVQTYRLVTEKLPKRKRGAI